MNRLAIFDCDGTLVDSGATIHRALEAAFKVHGLECPAPNISRKVIGLSLNEAMSTLAPEYDPEALSRTYKEAFLTMRAGGQVEEPLFDGILSLLDALKPKAGSSPLPRESRTAASSIALSAMASMPVSFPCKRPIVTPASRIRAWHWPPSRKPPPRLSLAS